MFENKQSDFKLNKLQYIPFHISAPYVCVLTREDLSDQAYKHLESQDTTPNKTRVKNYKEKKLISDFRPRMNYVCHIENLQYYQSKGILIKKIHSVISFEQDSFAKEFVEFSTKMRSQENCSFEKSLWKFINNVLFGKSMEGK